MNGFLLIFALVPTILAQTWTLCNPLNVTCPPNPALSTNHTFDFTTSQAGGTWNTTAGTIKYDTTAGGAFTINKKGDAPTIQSDFYLFFGQVEVWMKASPGQGVISSIVLQSDDLDEIDWEIIGSNSTHLETNYYGKGNTTDSVSRGRYYPLSPSAQDEFHNYTLQWTKEKLEWFVDGGLIRTLKYEDANGGANYPQTPMNIRIGIWAGGDEANNKYTIEWAGGKIDYSKAPYSMFVKSVRATDFGSAKEYKYGDHSGSWQSIESISGNSTNADKLNAPPAKTISQRWAGLSTAAKIGIGAGVLVVLLALLALFFTYCIRQRRAGARDRLADDAKYSQATTELLDYRANYQQRSGWERL